MFTAAPAVPNGSWEHSIESQLIAEECSRREDIRRGCKAKEAAVTG